MIMHDFIKIKICKLLLFVFFAAISNLTTAFAQQVSLNGIWETGTDRLYTNNTKVPGITTDPAKINSGKQWFKKEVVLPGGNWKYAVLELKGARFIPEVYVNGEFVSKQNGGMGPTFHRLAHKDVLPGNTITIEIALNSLKDVPLSDASYIPVAEQWRSNISSCLWDDVILHVYKSLRIEEPVPFIDIDKNELTIKYNISADDVSQKIAGTAVAEISSTDGKTLLKKQQIVSEINNAVTFNYGNILKKWSPEHPFLYRVKIRLINTNGTEEDSRIISLGIKKFEVKNKQFYLNNEPCKVAGGTVVWHRVVRTTEGRELGFDTAWFIKNVILRLKDHGANYLRFHMGKPPERLLDLCDRYGLLVQYEWSFFHGMPATQESIEEQFKPWLDVAMRHPCVSLVHPYNETEENQLQIVWNALDNLLPNYPPLVLEDRDVIHVHKYWWSLFENLGLYYDDYQQFNKAIMVDEFGGNYLDENGDLGGYLTLKESFMRFLGRNHTAEQRLLHQAEANGKVGEYWRRIGAAGIAPVFIYASWEDGNNWFIGNPKNGKEKPVWNWLTAAWSPQSVSIEIWDRNFTPNQNIVLPVYAFNNENKSATLKIKLDVSNDNGKVYTEKVFDVTVNAFSKIIKQVPLQMPVITGNYIIRAELLNRSAKIKYPVFSEWHVHVYSKNVPSNLENIKVAVPENETEVKAFLKQCGIASTNISDESARVLITSEDSWNKIAGGDKTLQDAFEKAIAKGTSVVMLDVGEKQLGQGYPKNKSDLGNLQGVTKLANPKTTVFNLFSGIKVNFTEAAEPESHIHHDKNDSSLWQNIPQQYTWLWNGLRGGLISPAMDMEFSGLNSSSFLAQWKAHGADEIMIKSDSYYAYELQGFYEYSTAKNDDAVKKKLKDRVVFLVQDAPALAISINPQSPIKITDLSQGYKDAQNGIVQNLIPLVNAGKNLTRTPVMMIDFGKGKGKLIASQLLTKGRLAKGFGENGLYGIRYDEVAVQFVLNMLSLSVK